MKTVYKKIETWLEEKAGKIIEFSLQKPATEDQINELEAVTGKKLPDDFKELYFWHNGLNDEENFGSLFYGMDFFPVERIISDHVSEQKNHPSEKIALIKADRGIDPENMHNADWLKFAFDGSHTGLYLDLAPAVDGKYGQIIFIDHEYEVGILVADSTAELVQNFQDDLENSLYDLEEDALEDGNHYLDTDPRIDIVNWEMSETWKR